MCARFKMAALAMIRVIELMLHRIKRELLLECL